MFYIFCCADYIKFCPFAQPFFAGITKIFPFFPFSLQAASGGMRPLLPPPAGISLSPPPPPAESARKSRCPAASKENAEKQAFSRKNSCFFALKKV
ncbi:MAG: hypothetical protein IKD96_03075 [Oscillospiraceae bacterium]|nr:hypothetical protein [Oscillospiraceae bacterium]